MTTAATDSHGTLLQRETSEGSGTYATVGEVRDIGGPKLTKSRHDATSHDSGGYTERISGVKTTGPITFEINWIPSNATHSAASGLVADYESQVDKNYRLVFPDTGSETATMRGTVSEFEILAPVDGVLRAKVAIDPTGGVTWS